MSDDSNLTQPQFREGMNNADAAEYRRTRNAMITAHIQEARVQRAYLPAATLDHASSGNPLLGANVGSDFSMRVHPITGVLQPHNALDLTAADGNPNSPVHAPASGYVIYLGRFSKEAGQSVLILNDNDHIDWTAHLEPGSMSHLRLGQRVTRGDVIGQEGHSGYATGNHVHYVQMIPRGLATVTSGYSRVGQGMSGSNAPMVAQAYEDYGATNPVIDGHTYHRGNHIPASPAIVAARAGGIPVLTGVTGGEPVSEHPVPPTMQDIARVVQALPH